MASISFAPYKLWQDILPWKFQQQGAQFGLFNVNIGQTAHPEIEDAILDEVGSYGKQIGRIGDVLQILLRHVTLDDLSAREKDAIEVLAGQLAAVTQVKRGFGRGAA
jgi:hypothetical protein